MSRGTTYKIYQILPGDKIEIDKDLVIKNYDLVNCPYVSEDHKNPYNWSNLPDVINGGYFLNGELTKDEYGRVQGFWYDEDEESKKPTRYFLKDGRELGLLGSWDLCSWSIFIMESLLDFSTRDDEKIIEMDKIDKFIDAVDFALHCKRLKTNKGADYVEAVQKNYMIGQLNSEGLVPLPSTSGEPNEMEYEESAVLEVRDIFRCYKTLCTCDGPGSRKTERIITVGYWG